MRYSSAVFKLSLFLFICSSLTSCASIIHGRRQEVAISSNPIGATVSDGSNVWTTPAKVSLPRKNPQLITISKPGYQPQTVRLERTISGVVFANVLAGGIIGWGVDAISGAQWKLIPETVDVTLVPNSHPIPVPVVIEAPQEKKPAA